MGDFNIIILNNDTHKPTKDFLDLLNTNSFYPLISKPNRITDHSATLIDNIFTNNLDYDLTSGSLYTDISDRLPVFQITNLKLTSDMHPKPRHSRVISSSNIQSFRSKLLGTDWNSIINAPSASDSYDQFLDYLTPIYNQCFPIKEINPMRNNSKHWLTPGLLTSCRRKNSLYKQAKITPTPYNKMKYNKYRNKYNNIIKMARKQYYHNKLTSISSSLRDTWSVIKSVISKKQSSQKPMVMKDSDGQYSNLEQIVQKFNNYFANVGSCLAKKIPQTNADSYKEQMTGTYNNNIFLSPTTANEICTIVSSLKSSKSEGWDGINIIPIKATIDLLSSPLQKLQHIPLHG